MDTLTKETPMQFAIRTLGTTERNVSRYQREIGSENFDSWSKIIFELQAEPITESNAQAVIEACKTINSDLTLIRVRNIRRLVENSLGHWANGRFAVPFAETEASKAAAEWLKGFPVDAERKVATDWIQSGWALLKGGLFAPWGLCPHCERNARLPIAKKDPATSEYVGWYPIREDQLCRDCHSAKREAESTLAYASQGRADEVVSPGKRKDAARHSRARSKRKDGFRSGSNRKHD